MHGCTSNEQVWHSWADSRHAHEEISSEEQHSKTDRNACACETDKLSSG